MSSTLRSTNFGSTVAESQLIGSILTEDVDTDEVNEHLQDLRSTLRAAASVGPLIQRSTSAPPQLAALDGSDHTFIAALKRAQGTSTYNGTQHPSQNTRSRAEGEGSATEGDGEGTVVVNGETVSANDPRLSPEYYAYYYLQRPLDPRLPPPLFNWCVEQTHTYTPSLPP